MGINSMKLIGSTTSPYVRKVRLVLHKYDYLYEFETIQALSAEGAQVLKSYGSVIRVPILKHGDLNIFDSSIIVEYLLAEKGSILSLEDKLKLRLIDELCDSGIDLLKQKIWNIDCEWKDKRSEKVLARYNMILSELDQNVDQYKEIQKDWLYCVLDWLSFRSVFNWRESFKNLEAFYEANQSLEKYFNTDPRL
jgi:glutathione S-transferase